MPYKKKAPAKRTKKAVGGTLSEAQKRLLGQAQAGAVKKGAGAITKQIVGMTRKYGDQRKATAAPAKRKGEKPLLAGRITPAMEKKAAATMKARKATQAKKMSGLSAAQRNLLGQAQANTFKSGKGTKAISKMTKKYGMTKAGMAAGIAAGKAVAAKYKKTKAPATQRGGIAMSKEARAKLMQQQKRRRMPTAAQLAAAKRRGSLTLAQKRARMQAARKRAMAARKRRGPSSRGTLTAAQRLLAARRRAAARRARSSGRPALRKPPTRRTPTRRPATRGRRGLGRAVRTIRKAFR